MHLDVPFQLVVFFVLAKSFTHLTHNLDVLGSNKPWLHSGLSAGLLTRDQCSKAENLFSHKQGFMAYSLSL